jgi:raffinose/stachyose/melibiose transport system permease protein
MRYTWKTFSRELILLLVAVVWWIPFYFLVTIAVRPSEDLFKPPMQLPSSVDLGNFSSAWKGAGSLSMNTAMVNSIIITVISVVLLIIFGSACAWAVARHPGKMGVVLYLLFAVGIILPFQLGIVPIYAAFRHLGLVGNYAGIIVLNVGLQMPFAVFLYTGFVRTLPREYEEAATVDGAGPVKAFVKVVFPLLRPVTGTVAILTSIGIWNDFFNPLIFLGGTDKGTVPLAIYSFVGEYATQWNLIFAAVIIALIPMLLFFIVAQRQMVKGFAGGLKG